MQSMWKKRGSYSYFVYMACLVVLFGCVSPEGEPSVSQSQPTLVITRDATTPTLSPTPTSTPSSTATASPTATNQPEATPLPSILPTVIHESDAQEAETTSAPCLDMSLVTNYGYGKVRWRVDDVGNLNCCELVGIHKMYQNPDPTSNMAVFSVIKDRNVPVYSANVLVDLATGAFKILGDDYTQAPRNLMAWLPDGRVVWANERGEMYIGSLETQESLNAPAVMTDLWFVAPNRILARDETFQFWYIDLTNSIWTQLPTEESEKITWRWIDYAAVSDDSDYTFFFFVDYSAILSNDSGTVQIVSPKFDPPDEYYVIVDATEGDTMFPPQQVKGTPYWFFRTEWVFREFEQISYVSRGFIVDSTTGAVVEHDILGIPTELAIYNSYLSPDEMWVAVEVVRAIQTLENYPAEVSQTWFISLTTGEIRVEEGEFSGWEAEREAYLDTPLACTRQEIIVELPPVTGD